MEIGILFTEDAGILRMENIYQPMKTARFDFLVSM
jgi:hypothetical protein